MTMDLIINTRNPIVCGATDLASPNKWFHWPILLIPPAHIPISNPSSNSAVASTQAAKAILSHLLQVLGVQSALTPSEVSYDIEFWVRAD